MIVINNNKKLEKFKRDAERKPDVAKKYEYFCKYIQLAETQKNALELSKLPWKWRKFHKLSGDRNNQYSFGISGTDRTTCYGNDQKVLPLNEVTEIEIINYTEDYH